MKVFAVAALTLAVLCLSSADEDDKRTRILKFWKCLTCSEDPAMKEEFMKCAELKPEKCKKVTENCKNEILGGIPTMEERWSTLCKSEGGEMDKMYDCIMNPENKKDLTDEEKTQLKDYVRCAKNVDKKFCTH